MWCKCSQLCLVVLWAFAACVLSNWWRFLNLQVFFLFAVCWALSDTVHFTFWSHSLFLSKWIMFGNNKLQHGPDFVLLVKNLILWSQRNIKCTCFYANSIWGQWKHPIYYGGRHLLHFILQVSIKDPCVCVCVCVCVVYEDIFSVPII